MAQISDIYNYYETLVNEYIDALELEQTKDIDYITDLTCLALNQLPAYYIRYGVDMHYFTSEEKKKEMDERVNFAVNAAINWLEKKEHQRSLEQ
jgi:hypothetical protein